MSDGEHESLRSRYRPSAYSSAALSGESVAPLWRLQGYSSNWNTSSSGTPNTRAMRKAASRLGE